jgi:hypothetical protein
VEKGTEGVFIAFLLHKEKKKQKLRNRDNDCRRKRNDYLNIAVNLRVP